MLRAAALTKRYEDGTLALDRLTLDVADGELFCLLGANGAGKSTAIHLFLDLVRPTAGEAIVDGIVVARDSIAARRRIAYVPENVHLYPGQTGRENLVFFTRLGGRPAPSDAAIAEALGRVELDPRVLDARVRRYSKGMRQKLAIAIALLCRARNLILDEPTSGLDPRATHDCMRLLERLRDEGCAILVSTHDLLRARQHADRVGILRGGRLLRVLGRDELRRVDLEATYVAYMTADPAHA